MRAPEAAGGLRTTSRVRFRRHYGVAAGRLDMAPLVDVVLNLLVYFMLTSSFLMQPGLHIKLPEAKTTEPVEVHSVLISITSDNRVFVDNREVTLADLGRELESLGPGRDFEVLVQGDENALHGTIVRILDLARLAGARRLVIATSPEM